MPEVYCDKHLKEIVEARAVALSTPDDGIIVSERDALVDMLEPQYRLEYQRRKGEHQTQ